MALPSYKPRKTLSAPAFVGAGRGFSVKPATKIRTPKYASTDFAAKIKSRIKSKIPSMTVEGEVPKFRNDKVPRSPIKW